ncbi:hypothetical protein FUAX_45310 (plasmid) [Fulvitalea axinellae]|uniref:Tox-MPTase3 domain-containing protein n=1 Tax=Fulvitalea axinellae TaxID=1182444 RepID=A0AAU9D021_9BACT|nr:hypothetical protein FUAX_45310 [Fulvitalea axinellae]
MKQSRKETAWKKSRKFGDVKGGRMRPKLTDNIFNRLHSFEAPEEGESSPIYILDNPSRDFFFPVTVEEIKEFISKLPKDHIRSLTHIWLRRISKNEFQKNKGIQGCFICGSGVNLIVLYPFPIDLKIKFGLKKPSNKILKWYSEFKPELIHEQGEWKLKWINEGLKRYYLEGLLLHEIGHKVESYSKRFWSKSSNNKCENFADNYAYYWGDKIRKEIE